jgi:PhzF family phenazine biosynthesis protein
MDREIRFETRSGVLRACRRENRIELDFPSEPPSQAQPPCGLLEALGGSATYVGKNRFDYLVELESEEELRNLKPDFARLGQVEVRGIIVTSRSRSPEFDFVSRFFAPWAGVDEDPVTGSAHCCLGPYWRGRLQKDEFVAYQASDRGGVVRVRVTDERSHLAGAAVTVLRGEFVA